MHSINPTTGETLREYPELALEEACAAAEHAAAVQIDWARTTWEHRSEAMGRAASQLRERAEPLARLMAEEMGKPLREGRAEVEKCAWVCEYYAEHARAFLADEPVDTDAARSFVAHRPLGVVLAVMPWNFPLWQVFRFAAPALMAGNAGLLKHASNVPGCALAIEEIFRDAGFPEGLMRTLLVGSALVPPLIEHAAVRAATLTGSEHAGRAVAACAGKALKKTVLELGGSDPYVVLADADLERAAETCVVSRMINTGQSCIAAKRFIVVADVRAEFEAHVLERMRAVRFGSPFDEDVTIGPMARTDLRDELHEQVMRSVAQGARIALGGEVPAGPGAFYPPTLLTGVQPGMPAYEEELFGPAAALIEAPDEAAAVKIANDTAFGLGAAVFTRDVERGQRIAALELDAGACFVNAFVKSDPRLPFGGIKLSGYGRELSSLGIREFVNAKTVYVA